MKTSKSPTSLRQVWKNHFETPDPEYGARLTMEGALALMAQCENAELSYKAVVSKWLRFGMFLVFIAVAIPAFLAFSNSGAGYFGEPPPLVVLVLQAVLAASLATICGFLLVIVCAEHYYHVSAAEAISSVLVPLAAGTALEKQCTRALRLVKTSIAARAYRDLVLAQGRELLQLDVNVMRSLQDKEIVDQRQAEQDRARKELQLGSEFVSPEAVDPEPPEEPIAASADISEATEPELPSGYYLKPPHGWTCFHCGETLTTNGVARDHFGATPVGLPGCFIKVGEERGLLMAMRRAEDARDEALAQLSRAEDEAGAASSAAYAILRMVPNAGSASDVRNFITSLEGRVWTAEGTLRVLAEKLPDAYQAACIEVCGPGTYYPPTIDKRGEAFLRR